VSAALNGCTATTPRPTPTAVDCPFTFAVSVFEDRACTYTTRSIGDSRIQCRGPFILTWVSDRHTLLLSVRGPRGGEPLLLEGTVLSATQATFLLFPHVEGAQHAAGPVGLGDTFGDLSVTITSTTRPEVEGCCGSGSWGVRCPSLGAGWTPSDWRPRHENSLDIVDGLGGCSQSRWTRAPSISYGTRRRRSRIFRPRPRRSHDPALPRRLG
jgi:hypothetical protein